MVVQTGNLSKVYSLLDKGIDVDYTNNNGDTALKMASLKGHAMVVRILQAKDAKLISNQKVAIAL